MAKRKVKDYSDDTLDAAGITDHGSNGAPLDEDMFERHVSAILRNRNGRLALALAEVKAAKKVEKDLKADAKRDNIKLVPLEAYLTLRQLESEDDAGEAAKAYVSYFRYGGLLGEQAELFPGLTPTAEEDYDRWYRRGFKDIREGAFDPDTGPIMPGIPPKYVPAGGATQGWLQGAAYADEKNMVDFLTKQGVKGDTPIEQAAKPKAGGKAKGTPASAPPLASQSEAETKAVVDGEFAEANE